MTDDDRATDEDDLDDDLDEDEDEDDGDHDQDDGDLDDDDDPDLDDADGVGYADALGELEAILEELEDDAIDIDVLAERVARASELIRVCRARIASARVQVDRIVADLEQLGGDDQPTLL
jgi:exodeoxyribonuclease VII small subunit